MFSQKSEFRSFARIPPIDLLKLDPDIYRLIVAVTELVCVGAILLMEYRVRILATWILLGLMVGALYTHIMMHHPPEKMGGAIFGLVIVLLRLFTMGEIHVKID